MGKVGGRQKTQRAGKF